MTKPHDALSVALALARRPALAKALRNEPLPPSVLTVIRLAAGRPETVRAVAARTGKAPAFLQWAAVSYIYKVVWTDDGDPYRVLGAASDASPGDLAVHLLWLMRWATLSDQQAKLPEEFSWRVLDAWDEVKPVKSQPVPGEAILGAWQMIPSHPTWGQSESPRWDSAPQIVLPTSYQVFASERAPRGLSIMALAFGLIVAGIAITSWDSPFGRASAGPSGEVRSTSPALHDLATIARAVSRRHPGGG